MYRVHISLESLLRAGSIYLNRGRQRAMLAATQLDMLAWLNTDNNNFGCTQEDFSKEGISSCVYIMNQKGTVSDAETNSRQSGFLLFRFQAHGEILLEFQTQSLISRNSSV